MDQQVILVVDDNKDVVLSLSKLLEYEGYKVLAAYDGMEALDMAVRERVDLILLDIMMPKINGLSALIGIRKHKKIPIIILSAKSEESDKISGLSMGADDYVTKPYDTGELMARVAAQLRRYLIWNGGMPEENTDQIQNGGLILDIAGKNVLIDGQEIKLTAKEYSILFLLMSNQGKVFSAEEIYEKVWKENICYAVENTVMVHIRRIREKIEINPKKPKYVKVVWGIGYKMEKQK